MSIALKLRHIVNEGGTLDDAEALAFAEKGLWGIINPEASLLATISAAVSGTTNLVADPRLKEYRQSVNASLLTVYSSIEKMIDIIKELENNAGHVDAGVGKVGDGGSGSALLDSTDHGSSLSG